MLNLLYLHKITKDDLFIKQVPVYTTHRLAWNIPGDTEVRHSMVAGTIYEDRMVQIVLARALSQMLQMCKNK